MRTVLALMDRNRKLFFKDKGMLFTSMITPVILIVLYATFLAKVFKDSFTAAIPDMITISDKLINGTVAAQLTASLMAVSCITVTFCVNLTMVQDKANGTWKDFNVSPVSKGKIFVLLMLYIEISRSSKLVSKPAKSPGLSNTGPDVILIPTPNSFAKILAKVVFPNPGGP